MRREVLRIKKTLEELGKLACKGEVLTVGAAPTVCQAWRRGGSCLQGATEDEDRVQTEVDYRVQTAVDKRVHTEVDDGVQTEVHDRVHTARGM